MQAVFDESRTFPGCGQARKRSWFRSLNFFFSYSVLVWMRWCVYYFARKIRLWILNRYPNWMGRFILFAIRHHQLFFTNQIQDLLSLRRGRNGHNGFAIPVTMGGQQCVGERFFLVCSRWSRRTDISGIRFFLGFFAHAGFSISLPLVSGQQKQTLGPQGATNNAGSVSDAKPAYNAQAWRPSRHPWWYDTCFCCCDVTFCDGFPCGSSVVYTKARRWGKKKNLLGGFHHTDDNSSRSDLLLCCFSRDTASWPAS